MSVTERLMAAGSWSLELSEHTPQQVLDLFDQFGHVYVFSAPPALGLSDTSMKALARWCGVVRSQSANKTKIQGSNAITWLGQENGSGPLLVTAVGALGTPASFATYITAILAQCAAIAAGTATAVAGTHNPIYQWITARQALDDACSVWGAEYRVSPSFTLDTAPVGSSAIFVQTPIAAAIRKDSGRDIAIVGIEVTDLETAVDSEDYAESVYLQDASSAWTLAAGSAPPYKDGRGNALNLKKPVQDQQTQSADASAVAANLLSATQTLHRQITLKSDEFDIDRDIKAGDYIWVYDPLTQLADASNQVYFRGQLIYPLKLRCYAVTWPIEAGHSVWYRDWNGVWTELTHFVNFDNPGATLEVGASSRPLTSGGVSLPGGVSGSSPTRAGAYRTAAYNSVAAVATRFPFSVKRYDPNANFDIVTNVGRYTCPVAGFYDVRSFLSVGAAGRLFVSVYVNGAEVRRGTDLAPTGGGVAAEVQCAAGDFIEIWYFTTNAVAFNVAAANCWVDIRYTGN